MDNERVAVGGRELVRWALVALVIAAGIGFFFMYARETGPVVQPAVEEALR